MGRSIGRWLRRALWAAGAAGAVGTAGCSESLGPEDVASVTVQPAADTLIVGQTVQLRAVLKRANGDTLTGLKVAWSSSDPTVAAVDTTGLVTAKAIGRASIVAAIGAQTGSAAITVTGPWPTVSSVSPATGTAGTELTVRGTNFRPGAAVLLDTLPADSVTVVPDSVIYALVPAGAATAGRVYAVTVVNADGTRARRDSAFRPVAPVLQFVNGATKPSGNIGSTVIIEGQAFGDRQGTGQVLFSNGSGGTIAATIASPGDWTNTFIVTTVPSGAATGDVKVQTASGTSAALTFTVTSNAAFSPSTISWTATTSLPVGLSGHAAAFATVGGSNLVYVIGGADSLYAPRADVLYSTIQSNGQLSAWTSTSPLPAGLAFHAAVVATPFNSRVKAGAGFVYVLGGATTAAGAPVNTVYRGTLDATGAVTAWTQLAPLPAPLHSLRAVIFRGDLYLAGGSTTGNQPVATVYRARIDSTGTLGPWQPQPALPFARSYAALGQFGGALYVFGGDSAAVTPNDSNYTNNGTKQNQIAYAKINLRTGDLLAAGWTVNPSALTKAVSKHTAVVAGGNVLVTGGLYNGAATGSTEESYAQFNSDGTVSSFNGATGSHTIVSAGGKNLFNHAALGYVDASGVAHVLILGGDDVNNPGRKRKEVWFY